VLKYGAPGENRTPTPGLQNRTSTTKDTRAWASVFTEHPLQNWKR